MTRISRILLACVIALTKAISFTWINPDGQFVNVVTGNASGEELAYKLRQMMKPTV